MYTLLFVHIAFSMLVWSIIDWISSVLGQVAAMTVDDAIFNLETYGRHMGNRYIAINHDRHDALLLQNAVIVLEDVGMLERDPHPKWSHCTVRIINRPKPKIDYTKGL